jgi:hypothetical protein
VLLSCTMLAAEEQGQLQRRYAAAQDAPSFLLV